jgi:hypothetical protein
MYQALKWIVVWWVNEEFKGGKDEEGGQEIKRVRAKYA